MKEILKKTWEVFQAKPIIVLPFFITGIADTLLLTLLYLAPRPPLSAILAPPIRVFWGEQYLHYPTNFGLLPTLFYYGHVGVVAFVGVFMTALAIQWIKAACERRKICLARSFLTAGQCYLTLLLVFLLMYGVGNLALKLSAQGLALKGVSQLLNGLHLGKAGVDLLILVWSFVLGILVQSLFVYAFPAAAIEGKRMFKALKRNFQFFRKYGLLTIGLVALPTLLYISVVVLRLHLPQLIKFFAPEMVLVVLGVGIVMTFLIDVIATSSTTVLFLMKRDEAYD